MKKATAMFLIVCFIASLMLFTFNVAENVWGTIFPNQVARASTIRTTPYGDGFLQYYFYNLRSNLSNNKVGTCGYVAVGMLLSYYDTYWNDDIVPEEYETVASISSLDDVDYNSPGAGEITHAVNTCGYAITENNLYDLFLHLGEQHGNEFTHDLPYFDDSLHGELIAHRISLPDSLDAGDLRSIEPSIAKDVTDRYLSIHVPESLYTSFTYIELSGMEDNDMIIESSNLARARIIANVKSDIPVAIYIGSITNFEDRHVAIAYDYDPDNDMLYFHMGYRGAQYYFSEQSYYMYPKVESSNGNVRYYYGDFTCFINCDHNHSNNYLLNGENAVCSCQLSDHTHSCFYKIHNESYHKNVCYCGYATIENHVYKYENLRYVCRYCGLIYPGGTPPIAPALPVYSNIVYNSEWIGVNVVNMEVPSYEA